MHLSPQASLSAAGSRHAAMEGEEEQPPQEAHAEPPVTSGASEGVPRVLSGEPQNLSDVDAFNLLLEMKLKRRRERPHLPRTVTELVAEDGSRVYVVGTAHFSDDSKKDVVKVSRHTAAPQAGPWPLPLPPDPTAARRAQALRPHSLPARRRPAVGPPF